MINIDSSIIYVPKSSITAGGNSIRFISGVTKAEHNVSIDSSSDFHYRVNTYGMPFTNGQYVYQVYLDSSIYETGVAQYGEFEGPNISTYNNKITYTFYGQ